MFSSANFDNYIVKYVKMGGTKVGLVGAFRLSEEALGQLLEKRPDFKKVKKRAVVVLGWALCSPNDKFDKIAGVKLAADRAYKRMLRNKPLYDPGIYSQFISYEYDHMAKRAADYFKDCTVYS